MKKRLILEPRWGVETPIPPKMMNAAAPGGAPPRRISKVGEKILSVFVLEKNRRAPPCLEEALRRVTVATIDLFTDFHSAGVNPARYLIRKLPVASS